MCVHTPVMCVSIPVFFFLLFFSGIYSLAFFFGADPNEKVKKRLFQYCIIIGSATVVRMMYHHSILFFINTCAHT